ncbi:MAG: class I SAM-dependent methyltransferase [Bacteroidales bacterium]|jgi:glycine/sarcosine N-methyltransferase|nr:class I SAM-dependent methyltransferase [Bacteroidales bacterium]
MKFYESIAPYYHHIFPVKESQVKFVKSNLTSDLSNSSILDVGCAVGDMSVKLSDSFQSVIGIDLDEQLCYFAQEKAKGLSNLDIKQENMLSLGQVFHENQFDSVICFGNTIVHLSSENEILEFFTAVYSVLKENGCFMFQIVNYDRVLDNAIDELPSIENDYIRFERKYVFQSDTGKIQFDTHLLVKENAQTIDNSVLLYPIRKKRLISLLETAGFTDICAYGSFSKENFSSESKALVVSASN